MPVFTIVVWLSLSEHHLNHQYHYTIKALYMHGNKSSMRTRMWVVALELNCSLKEEAIFYQMPTELMKDQRVLDIVKHSTSIIQHAVKLIINYYTSVLQCQCRLCITLWVLVIMNIITMTMTHLGLFLSGYVKFNISH